MESKININYDLVKEGLGSVELFTSNLGVVSDRIHLTGNRR
jgi:hypothetical protein